MKLSEFDYHLPKGLIAQYPSDIRGSSRMLVLDRKKKSIEHKRFSELAGYLGKGDTVVFNDSRVVPARIICKKETGGKAEIFLLKKVGENLYEGLARPSSRISPGTKLICDGGKITAQILERLKVGRLIRFSGPIDLEDGLSDIGRVPLPPYIKRVPEDMDKSRYQTIYAKEDGSTAAPTAGLHFTKRTLSEIKKRGVNIAYVTLHISYGTFAPIKAEEVENHVMHKEDFALPEKTCRLVSGTSGRVVAVGTTAVRVLEGNSGAFTSLGMDRKGPYKGRGSVPRAGDIKGETDIFIYPGFKFKTVGALLTNFHLPKSTLLLLVCAFAGRDFILKAYLEAVREKYRFYSYGDCMLII